MGGSESKTEINDVVVADGGDDGLTESLRINLSRLIAYAESADVGLQREVAERLANEAVKREYINPCHRSFCASQLLTAHFGPLYCAAERQAQIAELGGLRLLLPLTKSSDPEVQRLAAHALANLSVNADNQSAMAENGGIEMLIDILGSPTEHLQRQACKSLANLGVNVSILRRSGSQNHQQLIRAPHVCLLLVCADRSTTKSALHRQAGSLHWSSSHPASK